ncbi:MAG: PAS domain S-box protein [Magnetococcales bacterium]|nr:PAS domain S-box protein [Magnetococcales bacterium]MBF0114038.1 PAS domain S-box protein [Magnetococcales bacterium]
MNKTAESQQNTIRPAAQFLLSLVCTLIFCLTPRLAAWALDDPNATTASVTSAMPFWQSLLGMGGGILVLALVLKWNHHLSREVEERRQIEQRLSLALEGGNLGLWDVDLLSGSMVVNARWAEMLGYTLAEIEPLHRSFWLSTIHPADRERVLQLGRACQMGEQERYVAEYRAMTKEGEVRWFMSRGAIVAQDADGKATRMVGTVSDTTARKQMEEALRASEARHALILASVADGILVMDTTGSITFANQAALTMLGWQPDALIGKPMHATLHHSHANGERYPGRECPTRKALQDGIASHTEDEVYWRQDGSSFAVEYSSVPMRQEGELLGAAVVFRDVSQKRQAESRIRILNQLVYGSLESASVGAWWIDFSEEDTFHALDTTARLLGMPSSTHTDKSYRMSELFQRLEQIKAEAPQHADRIDATLAELRGTIAGEGEFFNSTFAVPQPENRLHWLNVRGYVSQRDSTGQAQLMTGTVIDITDQKSGELAMQQAKQAAEEAARVKSDFLANMSHEIRTPMNGIIGMVDLIQQSELNAKQRRMLATIQESSTSLLNILNDILDFSKIEAGKMVVEHTPTLLREVVEGSVQLMYASANGKTLDLSVYVDPRLPRWILADPTRLRQIILNLVGNAVKFTSSNAQQQGRVAVRAEAHSNMQNATQLVLRIRDNGIGISQKNIKKLFQPFSQADASTSRKFGGTGLGLSITQRLVQLMGGSISVHSVPGTLTEFSVILPITALPPPADRPLNPEPDLQGLALTIVAPDAVYAEILDDYCRAAGAHTQLFRHWNALLAHWQNAATAPQPALLLLDDSTVTPHDLPAGVRLVRLMRNPKSASWSDSVTISATPLVYQELVSHLAVAGGLLKPSAMVAMTERRKRARQPLPTVEEASAAGRLILLAEDNEINREVISEQLHILGYAVEVAEDGEIALAMWRSGRYGLLLTDCHMPNRDGFSLTTAILQEEAPGSHRPIIAVTANALQGEAERCIAHGMDDYLAKPLRIHELGAMLNKWLPLHPIKKEAAEQRPAATPSDPAEVDALPVWDANTLTRMVGENPEMQRRLLRKFLLSAPPQMAAIQEALDHAALDKVAQVAHAFKSAARMVGALRLGEHLQATERGAKEGDREMCTMQLWPQLQELLLESQQAIELFLQQNGDNE